MVEKAFKDLGLSEKEVQVYLTLLGYNSLLVSAIARFTKYNRATVYSVLERLKRKGFVTSVVSKNGTVYRSVDPKLVCDVQKEKVVQLEKYLPELQNLRSKYAVTPQMSLFEGVEGIIQIMEDTLSSEGDILCWSAGDEAFKNEAFRDYHLRYEEKKNRKKIKIRGLFQYDEVGVELKLKGKKDKREIYLIPGEKFPFENEINIYNDKMSIISHRDKVGVIIQNEAIANTQRSIFEFAFEYAKMVEPQILSEEHKNEFGY